MQSKLVSVFRPERERSDAAAIVGDGLRQLAAMAEQLGRALVAAPASAAPVVA